MFSLPHYTKLIVKTFFKDIKRIPLYYRSLNFKSFILFLKHPWRIRKYIVKYNISFSSIEGKLILNLNSHNVSFYIKNILNTFAINEVFIENAYNIDISKPSTVIDIGMNIGDTAIYFALMPNVKEVFAFEPFKDTYEQAVYNFELNKDLSEKIHPYNFGISDKNETIENILFSPENSGGMTSSKQYVKDIDIHPIEKHTADIELKSVNEVFQKIFNETKNKIILKIDCEGAEYEIFDALDKSGLINNIDYILLEYHYGSKKLLDIFEKNNFIAFPKYTLGEHIGFISAVKIK